MSDARDELRARAAITTSAEFLANEQRYLGHMERFMLAHRGAQHRDVLVELERTDRWAAIMGEHVAAILSPPTISMIEEAARRRGLLL